MASIVTANSEIGYGQVGKHTKGVDGDFRPDWIFSVKLSSNFTELANSIIKITSKWRYHYGREEIYSCQESHRKPKSPFFEEKRCCANRISSPMMGEHIMTSQFSSPLR
jgi:hypothetical protein